MDPEAQADLITEFRQALKRGSIQDGTEDALWAGTPTQYISDTSWDRAPQSVTFVRPMAILEAVSRATGYSLAEIRGVRRQPNLALARQLVCALITEMCQDLTSGQIASFMRRDHTTILYSVSAFKEKRKTSKLAQQFEEWSRKALA